MGDERGLGLERGTRKGESSRRGGQNGIEG